MQITLKCFAFYETLFKKNMKIEVEENSTVEAVFFKLMKDHPHSLKLFQHTMFAVNQAYVPVSTVLKENDELAWIPPVAGG